MRGIINAFLIGVLTFVVLIAAIMIIGFLFIKYTTISQIVLTSLFVLGIIFAMGLLVGELF